MKKGWIVSQFLSLGVCLFVLFLYAFQQLNSLEAVSVDRRFKWREAREPLEDIVIVTVDEKSVKEMGRWPWPRDTHAKLIDMLTAAGAKAITFDILFTEPDKDRPRSDDALGRAAEKSGRVVFGILFSELERGVPQKLLLPIEPLRRPGVQLGIVNTFPEVDGVNRKSPMWREFEGEIYPSLPLSTYALARNISVKEAVEGFSLPDGGDWNEMHLNFLGMDGDDVQSFPTVSFVDVYRGEIDPSAFENKIVFVGGSAAALFDFKAIPNVPHYEGVGIHATALDNLFGGHYLRYVHPAWTVLLVFLFSLFCGLLIHRAPAWLAGVSVVFWALGYWGLCQYLFARKNILVDMIPPTLALIGTYVVTIFYRYLTEQNEKRRIKTTFSRYFSPEVMKELMSDPTRLRLDGREQEVTVFFSDLVGFTSLSEKLPAKQLVAVLNEYFTEMCGIIFRHAGTVDKFIGDAIMAFWNAPTEQVSHPRLACYAALEQLELLKILQKKLTDRGLPLIDCRIGINTGVSVVGDMGSREQVNYTVIGDPVNLASRLEGANKPFHTHIMISEFTQERVKDDFETRPLDFMRVKGKDVPIRVYELVARKGGLTEAQKKGFALYEEGLVLYRGKRFSEALQNFEKALMVLPGDGPSGTYVQRCRDFITVPPPENWDGVYEMKTK